MIALTDYGSDSGNMTNMATQDE
jgi:hypothetical protein